MMSSQTLRAAVPTNEALDRTNDLLEKLVACGKRLETTALKLYDEGKWRIGGIRGAASECG